MELPHRRREPYCLLFCLGFISALQGALLWTLFEFQWISFYPKQAHAHLMIFGFLMAFISGFLMTAVPRMTASEEASSAEVIAAASGVVLQWIFCDLNLGTASAVLFVLQILILFAFFIRRFGAKKVRPPEGFVFIPFAFAAALLGATVYLTSTLGVVNAADGSRWLVLWTGQAFVLNLICGVGSRLIPVLSRLPLALPMTTATAKPGYKKMIYWALFLNLTFLFESCGHDRIGIATRAVWILLFSASSLGLFKTPSTATYLGKGLKSGLVFIFAGYVLSAIFPDQQLNFLHLVFIGGFSLMTLMVATRVVLAHGGQSTELEISSPIIAVVGVLFLLSALARAFVYPSNWHQGLLVGVGAFVIATCLWMLSFGRFTYPELYGDSDGKTFRNSYGK